MVRRGHRRRCSRWSALPFVANDYLVGVGLTLLMWLALTQSWCVLSKLTGYVSLGHVVFYGLGAYLVVVTWQQLAAVARDRRPPGALAAAVRARWSACRCCACAGRTS